MLPAATRPRSSYQQVLMHALSTKRIFTDGAASHRRAPDGHCPAVCHFALMFAADARPAPIFGVSQCHFVSATDDFIDATRFAAAYDIYGRLICYYY